MDYLTKLRAKLKNLSGELDAIIKKAKDDDRLLTKEEAERVDTISSEIDELDDAIKRQKKIDEQKARSAVDPNTPIDENGQIHREPASAKVDLTTIQKTGLISMAIAAGSFAARDQRPVDQWNPMKILADAGYEQLANRVVTEREKKQAFIEKVLNASTGVSGGFLTPDSMSNDIVELLYPETTFLQGGPRRVNMPNGTYRQPKGATGSSASYRQEGGQIGVTEPTFEAVNMSVKFLGAIIPMTRQMIDFTISGAQAFVEADLREAMSQTLDAKAYFGDGEQGEPLGLFSQTGIQTVTSADAATPTLDQIDEDFREMELALLNNNIRNMSGWRYVMAPRTLKFLQTRRVGNDDGEYAYPETRGVNPMMGTVPILQTTQFPINLGGGANETKIALINFSDVLLGIMEELMLATSNEASIYINGSMVSAFQNDLVFLRAVSSHDIGCRRPLSVVQMNSITWGA